MRYFFYLFLMFGLFFSSSVTLDLPAVSSEDIGSLVEINITVMEGVGNVYFSMPPYIGISYQKSFNNALNFVESEKQNFSKEHDFYIYFSSDDTSTVEGASGGIATAVILKSISEKDVIDNSMVVTGEIDSLGRVYPVGGVPEKLIASFFNNKSLLLIPSNSPVNEKILTEKFSREFAFPVYEYSNFRSVYDAYTMNDFDGLDLINIPEEDFKEVSFLEGVETNVFFNMVVLDMINEYNREIQRISPIYPRFIPHFDSIYQASVKLFDKGYSYSAGNEVFLAIEKISLLSSSYSDDEFEMKENKIKICLEQTDKNLNEFNGALEYFISSEVRYVKSKDVFETYVDEIDNPAIKIRAPSLLARSDLWCSSALMMSENIEYNDYERERLIDFVEMKLLEHSGNISSTLTTARKYYAQGYYGASLNEIINYEATIYECQNLDFKYNWPQMMYNHAIYLKNSTRYGEGSYDEISELACSFERNLIQYNSYDFKQPEYLDEKENTLVYFVCVVLIFILFMLSIIYYLLKKW